MPFLAVCPFCPARFRLSERLVAASVRCPNCGSYFTAAPVDDGDAGKERRLMGAGHAAGAPASPTQGTEVAAAADQSSTAPQPTPALCMETMPSGGWRALVLRMVLLTLGGGLAVFLTVQFWPRSSNRSSAPKFAMEEPDPNQFLLVTLDNRQMINDLGRTAWANAEKESLRQNNVHIRVAWAKIGTPPLKKGAAAATLPKSLLVQVQVANAAGAQSIRYRSLAKGTPCAVLVTEAGASVPLRTIAAEAAVADQIDSAVVAAGRHLQELLVFELPPADAEALKLEFPAAAFGGRGSCRFRIPRSMITAAVVSQSGLGAKMK